MVDPDELSEKVAIVTGAGQGMGRAVAKRLAAAGARLVVDDLNIESAERTASSIKSQGGDVLAIGADASSRNDVLRMVESTLEAYGAVHILINNAGVLRPTPVIDIEEDEWDLVIDVNLKGTYLCSREVLPPCGRRAGAAS